MPDWVQTRLGDLVDIKHGYAFKGVYFREELPGDFLLTPGNFAIGGGFQFGANESITGRALFPTNTFYAPGICL